MTPIGFYNEMKLYADNGRFKDNISAKINYDKEKVINYLNRQNKIASCPKAAVDCLTGKEIAPSFSIYSDGEFEWCDFLIYHIRKYNVILPQKFLDKI